MLTSNKTSIIRNWKEKYQVFHSPFFANKIELVTGEQAPFINGYDDGEEPSKLIGDKQVDELVGILDKEIF